MQSVDDLARRDRRKIGVRTSGHDRLVRRLLTRVVGDTRVAQVDGHALDAYAICAAVLADAEHRVGTQLRQKLVQRSTGGVKLRRNFMLDELCSPDAVGKPRIASHEGLICSPPNGVKPVTSIFI